MKTRELSIETGRRSGVVDITDQVRAFCSGEGDGLVSVFVPHATAGIAVFEMGAGSEVDVLDAIDELLPRDPARWHHEHGTPGHGRDHVLPAFVAPSITIPVIGGEPQLGTWQSVVLIDTNVDNPHRTIRLSFITG